jgi:hypothetical protein
MSAERKADVEARLAELEYELHLAIAQGEMAKPFRWTAVINVDGKPPYIALLSVAPVGTIEGEP